MKTLAFIDASNLFYGGEKSLGWKIDYGKLLKYLKEKYEISRGLYFGGIEIHNFPYNYLQNDTVQVSEVESHLVHFIKSKGDTLSEPLLLLLHRHIQRIRFYKKLEQFGYELHLKPVKLYEQEDGSTRRKANCDVDMALHLLKEKDNFERAIILSGDGDFLPVLKFLKERGKEVIILARGPRTAREIRQFAGANFRDFVRLEKFIRFEEK